MKSTYQALTDAFEDRWIGQSCDFDYAYDAQCPDPFKDERDRFGVAPHATGSAKYVPERTGGNWRQDYDWKTFDEIIDYQQLPVGSWVVWGYNPDGHMGRLSSLVEGGISVFNQWGSDNHPQIKDSKGNVVREKVLAVCKYSDFAWDEKIKGVLIPKYTPEQALEALRTIRPGLAEQFEQPRITTPIDDDVGVITQQDLEDVVPDIAEITTKAKKSGSKVGLIDTVFAGGGLGLYGLKDWFLNNVHGLDVHTITIAIVVLGVVYFWRKKTQENYKINQAIDEAITITPQFTRLLLAHKKRSMLTMRKPQ